MRRRRHENELLLVMGLVRVDGVAMDTTISEKMIRGHDVSKGDEVRSLVHHETLALAMHGGLDEAILDGLNCIDVVANAVVVGEGLRHITGVGTEFTFGNDSFLDLGRSAITDPLASSRGLEPEVPERLADSTKTMKGANPDDSAVMRFVGDHSIESGHPRTRRVCDGGALIRNPAIWAWSSKGRIAPRTSDPGFVFEDVEGETTLLERPVGLRADVEITYVGQTCIEDGEKRALGLRSAQDDADLVVLLVFNEATFALEDPLLAELSEDVEHAYNQRQWGEVAAESERPEEKLLRHLGTRTLFFFRVLGFYGTSDAAGHASRCHVVGGGTRAREDGREGAAADTEDDGPEEEGSCTADSGALLEVEAAEAAESYPVAVWAE